MRMLQVRLVWEILEIQENKKEKKKKKESCGAKRRGSCYCIRLFRYSTVTPFSFISSVNFTFAIVVLPPHHNFSIAHNRRKHNAVVVDHKYMGASAPNS